MHEGSTTVQKEIDLDSNRVISHSSLGLQDIHDPKLFKKRLTLIATEYYRSTLNTRIMGDKKIL